MAELVHSGWAGFEALELSLSRLFRFVVDEELFGICEGFGGFLAVDEVYGEAFWVNDAGDEAAAWVVGQLFDAVAGDFYAW